MKLGGTMVREWVGREHESSSPVWVGGCLTGLGAGGNAKSSCL